MDKSLFEYIIHFAKIEFKSGRERFLKVLIFTIGCAGYRLIGGEIVEESDLFLLILVLGPSVFLYIYSSLIPIAHNQTQQNSQSGAFSWKYFHTVVNDRHKFIIAFCISSLFYLFPAALFFALLIIFGAGDSLISLMSWTVPVVIGAILLKIMTLTQTITVTRLQRFRYNNSFKKIFFRLVNGTLKFSYYMIIFFGSFMVVVYTQAYSNFFGAITLSLLLLLILLIKYVDLIRYWGGENYKGWILWRDIPISLIFMFVTFYFFLLNIAHHGLMGGSHIGYEEIEQGNLRQLSEILEKDDYSAIKNREGSNFLHHAIISNRPKVADLLLKNGFDLKKKVSGRVSEGFDHRVGMSPLFLAIEAGADDSLKFILDQGLDPNEIVKGLPAIAYAAERCEPYAISLLIEYGANVNMISDEKVTPLFYGVKGECLVGIRLLIDNGANVEFKSPSGSTYLTYAEESHKNFYKSLGYSF